jgi:glycosyltransferase involved in cell wall biosynthesis
MSSKRRVSFFVHDLASNPIVRAAALAKALEGEYDVEVLGFLFSGSEVYRPYRGLFSYKTMTIPRDTATVLRAIPSLAGQASGDIIYACKPLATSFGPALYAARQPSRRLLLDVEDDEWVTPRNTWQAFLWADVLKGWRHATAWKYTRALHALVGRADSLTVSTRRLQQRYGGTILRHGPFGEGFDPDRLELQDGVRCRAKWNLPAGVPLALFAGVPQPHKGWTTLLDALTRPSAAAWHLVVAGPEDHPDFAAAAQALGSRCHVLGPQPNDAMPSLLAAIDAVPAPQLDTPFAQSQLPAKILEAMAMARPVVATRVGDLAEILGDGSRGWLTAPADAGALAAALWEIAANRNDAQKRGTAARAWFLDNASPRAIRAALTPLL